MNTTVSRNGSLEFFRFLFITVIVLWHFNNIVPIFQCGDFAVDFFFVLAGAMLYRSFITHPGQVAVQYTFRRVRRIFFEWVITLIPVFFIKNRDYLFSGTGLSFEQIVRYFLRFFQELFFLGQNGLYNGTSNYASWFICVLIVGGGILYAVLCFYKDKASLLFFPVFSLLALVYFYTLPPTELWSVKGCFDVQFLRGCAEIALGASLYHLAEKYQVSLQRGHLLVDILGMLSLVMLVILLFLPRTFAPYVPLFSCMLILACLTDHSVFYKLLQGRIWITLGGISFEMLLIHGLVKPIVSYAGIGALPAWLSVPLYLGLVIASAFGLKWLNNKVALR